MTDIPSNPSLEEGGIKVILVANSAAPTGERLVSFEVRTHRFTLAEWNTHCVFARNSASSRARPVGTVLEEYRGDPAYPIEWASERPGMSGGPPLDGEDQSYALGLWDDVRRYTGERVGAYIETAKEAGRPRVHKSLLNRLLEPMLWHTVLITASMYENFFDLRCSAHAQPEIRAAAEMMRELYGSQSPIPTGKGEWHLPYIRSNESVGGSNLLGSDGETYDARVISASRCAATSYVAQWNEDKSYAHEIERYEGLVSNGHWSPLEHVATPWEENIGFISSDEILQAGGLFPTQSHHFRYRRYAKVGKFPGWLQWRHVSEATVPLYCNR